MREVVKELRNGLTKCPRLVTSAGDPLRPYSVDAQTESLEGEVELGLVADHGPAHVDVGVLDALLVSVILGRRKLLARLLGRFRQV